MRGDRRHEERSHDRRHERGGAMTGDMSSLPCRIWWVPRRAPPPPPPSSPASKSPGRSTWSTWSQATEYLEQGGTWRQACCPCPSSTPCPPCPPSHCAGPASPPPLWDRSTCNTLCTILYSAQITVHVVCPHDAQITIHNSVRDTQFTVSDEHCTECLGTFACNGNPYRELSS